MDKIQQILIEEGRKDLAQEYYEKIASLYDKDEEEIDFEKESGDLYVVKGTVHGKKNETISKPMSKNKADQMAKNLKKDMEIAIPKYRMFKDIIVEKI